MSSKRIGGQYCFTYSNYGTPENYPEFRAHSNQIVTIVRKLGDNESAPGGGNKYIVRAADGWRGLALASELRTPGKAKRKRQSTKQKKVYVVCRHIVQTHMNVAVFYGVCSTEDRAQVLVDDLTKKEGPTFVIVPAVVDP